MFSFFLSVYDTVIINFPPLVILTVGQKIDENLCKHMHSCMSKFLYVHANPSLHAQMTIYALCAFFPTCIYTHARNVYFLTHLTSLLIAISTDLGSPEYMIKYIFVSSFNIINHF